MKRQKIKLLIEQADRKLSVFSDIKNEPIPQNGWIHTVRTTLRMSLRQFGERLNMNPSSAKEIELREVSGALTLRSLRNAANALDMQLVYGLAPKGKSLEEVIEKRAVKLAEEIVLRTSHTMSLEDQENSEERIRKAIQAQAEELKNEMPKMLWD